MKVKDLKALAKTAPAGKDIVKVGLKVIEIILKKNIAYGNSALEPIGIFSKLSPEDGLRLRLDDKLKRIKNSQVYPGDDAVLDLIGYLILLKVMERRNG